MADRILRGTCANNQIRFFAVDSTETVIEATEIHNCSTTASTAFGRLLSAGLMMGTSLKNESDALTLKVAGDGELGNIVVTTKYNARIKGFVTNPQVELPLTESKQINVKGGVGKGTLTIIKDLGLKQPYVGTIELVSGEIAEDLSYYYVKSEQIPTAIGLGVLIGEDGKVRRAGGFLVQLMPNTEEENIKKLEDSLAKFPNISDLLDMGFSIEHIIENILLKDFDFQLNETLEAKFECDCSYEKFLGGIKMLSNLELKEMVAKEEDIVAECHFCGKEYAYKPELVRDIIKEKQERMKARARRLKEEQTN